MSPPVRRTSLSQVPSWIWPPFASSAIEPARPPRLEVSIVPPDRAVVPDTVRLWPDNVTLPDCPAEAVCTAPPTDSPPPETKSSPPPEEAPEVLTSPLTDRLPELKRATAEPLLLTEPAARLPLTTSGARIVPEL